MFAQDLCPSRIEYLRNAIDVNRKDKAKRFLQSVIRNPQSKISFSGLGLISIVIVQTGQYTAVHTVSHKVRKLLFQYRI